MKKGTPANDLALGDPLADIRELELVQGLGPPHRARVQERFVRKGGCIDRAGTTSDYSTHLFCAAVVVVKEQGEQVKKEFGGVKEYRAGRSKREQRTSVKRGEGMQR
jgi:hypothetical protein